MPKCKCPASVLQEQSDVLIREIKTAFADIKPIKYAPYATKTRDTSRVLTVCLSDLHWGQRNVDGSTKYHCDLVTQRRALAYVVKNVVDYKRRYRDKTQLNVVGLGDWLEGLLLHGQPAERLSVKFVDLLTTMVRVAQIFSAEFPKVEWHLITGNHDRNKLVHQDRALDAKWDSYMYMLAHSIKAACAGLKNTTFHVPKTPYMDIKVFNYHMYATHMDTHFNLGPTIKSINVKNLVSTMNAINARGTRYQVFLGGHTHFHLQCQPTDAWLMISAALVPPGGFAESLEGSPARSQMMFESTPDFVVGDRRTIDINERVDKDKKLDALWSNF